MTVRTERRERESKKISISNLKQTLHVPEEFLGCFKVKQFDRKLDQRLFLFQPLFNQGHQDIFKELSPPRVAKVSSKKTQSLCLVESEQEQEFTSSLP